MKPKIVPSIHYKNCISCSMCIQVCPVSALTLTHRGRTTKYRNLYPELSDYEGCIGCKQCVSACPMDCIAMASYYKEDK